MSDHIRRAGYLAALFTLGAAGPARADALPPPPPDCPLGSQGSGLHCGMYCFALLCTKHSDCEDGATCQALEACIGTVDCFQNTPPVLGGPCSPEDTCLGEGETCQTIKVCLPGEGETSDDSGASSSTGTTSGETTGTTGTNTTGTTSGETTGTTSGETTSNTTTGATTTSTTTAGATSTASATEAAPTTGGMPSTSGATTAATTTGAPGTSTGGGSSSTSGDGTGGGDKAGCSGCALADGPPGVLGLMLVAGLARRRHVRP